MYIQPTLIFDGQMDQPCSPCVVQGVVDAQVIRVTSLGVAWKGLMAGCASRGGNGELGALAARAAWVCMAVMLWVLLPHLVGLNELRQRP